MRSYRVLVPALFIGLVLLLTACPGVESRPKPFSFPAVADAEPGAEVTSAEVTITGLSTPATATVSAGGTLIVNGNVVTSPATIANNSLIRVRVKASEEPGGTASATVDVAGVKATFVVTTRGGPTPGGYTFPEVTGAEPGASVTSDEVTISGLSGPVTATVTGGTLVVDGTDAGTSATVENGTKLRVRVTASSSFGATVTATVHIAGTSSPFKVTTRSSAHPAVELTTVPAGTTEARPGETVTLSWSIEGDFDTLTLTTVPASTAVDVTGATQHDVTVPSNSPTVRYVLTASHENQPGPSESASLELSVPLWVCEEADAVITIADPALDAEIRRLLSVAADADIDCDDVHSFHILDVGANETTPGTIASLVGLQHFENLEELKMRWNEVSDLTPLSGLPNLTLLDFDKNRVTDLSPIAGLTTLEHLAFWDSGPVRQDDVEDDEDLVPLGCRDGVSDLSPLAGLVNLQELYLSCNNVANISVLANMPDLRIVFMISNRITSTAPLSGKDQLRVLRASDNQLTGLPAVLPTLTDLSWLEVGYAGLRNDTLVALGDLEDLFALELEGNYFSNFAPLINNADFPDTTGGAGHYEGPVTAEISLAYNCITDPAAVRTAFVAKGLIVRGADPGNPQRDPAECAPMGGTSLGAASTGEPADQHLIEFRRRMAQGR